jgi:hypothetical protein
LPGDTYYGYVDPERIADANAEAGNAAWVSPFGDLFGNPNAVLHYMPYHAARILKFPERPNEKTASRD